MATTKGTGAAGGLVAANLACFKSTQILNGMDYIARLVDLEKQIAQSSIVFTGEGSFDLQTLEGKVVSKIHSLCRKYSKPLYILCGVNKLSGEQQKEALSHPNDKVEVFDLVSRYPIARAMTETEHLLYALVKGEVCESITRQLYI